MRTGEDRSWDAEGMDEPGVERWGRRIGAEVESAVVIALEGPLGAGKSVLARAVARGAGVEGEIPSPTYTLLNRYEGAAGRPVVHMDLYRIKHPSELVELGWDELGAAHEITLIEWPDRAGDELHPNRWEIHLMPRRGSPELRDIRVRRVGEPPELPSAILPAPSLPLPSPLPTALPGRP